MIKRIYNGRNHDQSKVTISSDSKQEEYSAFDSSRSLFIAIKFDPGRLGLNLGCWSGGFNGERTGLITEVSKKGQAESLGVQVGWKITLIDNEPYSEKLLDSSIRGKHPYTLTFETFHERQNLQNSDPPKLTNHFSVPLSISHSNGLSLRPSDITPRAKTPKGKRSKKNPFPVTKFGTNNHKPRRKSSVMDKISMFENAAVKETSSFPRKSRRKKGHGKKVDRLSAKFEKPIFRETGSPTSKKRRQTTN